MVLIRSSSGTHMYMWLGTLANKMLYTQVYALILNGLASLYYVPRECVPPSLPSRRVEQAHLYHISMQTNQKREE